MTAIIYDPMTERKKYEIKILVGLISDEIILSQVFAALRKRCRGILLQITDPFQILFLVRGWVGRGSPSNGIFLVKYGSLNLLLQIFYLWMPLTSWIVLIFGTLENFYRNFYNCQS